MNVIGKVIVAAAAAVVVGISGYVYHQTKKHTCKVKTFKEEYEAVNKKIEELKEELSDMDRSSRKYDELLILIQQYQTRADAIWYHAKVENLW